MVLNVLVVAHGHPDLSPGGAEWASYLLFRELRRTSEVRAHYLAWTDDAGKIFGNAVFSDFRHRRDETLFGAPGFDRFLLSQTSNGAQEKFAEFLRRKHFDVIHFHHYLNIGVECIAIARWIRPRARIVVTLHEYLAICYHYGLMVRTHDSALCENAHETSCATCFLGIPAGEFARRRRHIKAHFDQVDLFIAPSEFLRRRYIAWGLPSRRIVVAENGIGRVKPPQPRRRAKGECHGVFGYFGQIHPFKGLTELLSAFDRLSAFPAETTKGIRLIINGAYLELNDADYVASFKALLSKTAERVRFAGPYDRRSQSRLMAEVDWVIVPSIWWENSPLVIQEALAHRRPVICSNIGGMAEKVRHGKDGFHFPVGNSTELAALLVRLAADETVWDRLQSTMRYPITISESAANHLALYRDPSFSFATKH